MSAAGAELEREALDRLKEQFESQGYDFILNPSKNRLPDFLQRSQPDALAIGANETVVIEAKRRRSRASDILLKILAQDISSRPGWRLLVVYIGEMPDGVVEFYRAEQIQIENALQDARKLMVLGPSRVVLVTVWSIFEAMARSLYAEGDVASKRALSPIQIVERLASDGYLDSTEVKRLRALISARNLAVHGDLNINPSNEDLRFMLDKAEEISTSLNINE